MQDSGNQIPQVSAHTPDRNVSHCGTYETCVWWCTFWRGTQDVRLPGRFTFTHIHKPKHSAYVYLSFRNNTRLQLPLVDHRKWQGQGIGKRNINTIEIWSMGPRGCKGKTVKFRKIGRMWELWGRQMNASLWNSQPTPNILLTFAKKLAVGLCAPPTFRVLAPRKLGAVTPNVHRYYI